VTDKSLKILITDDEMALADALKNIISGLGHTCDVAYDGKDCLRKISQQHYDVLFLDLIMPKLDGEGVLESLRGREPQLDVIVISSEDDDEVIEAVLRHGATAYIMKPVSLESVENVIKKLIEKKTNESKHQ
jgi:DNA-binding response OmpR family regulator